MLENIPGIFDGIGAPLIEIPQDTEVFWDKIH